MQIAQGAPGARRPGRLHPLVPNRRARIGIERHVDGDLPQKLSFAVEHLDSPVAAIRHVNTSSSIDSKAVRSIELSRPRCPVRPRT